MWRRWGTPHHYQNLNYMIYSSWDIEQNILKLVILGHFFPFNPLKTEKSKILKNEKTCWRYHHLHLYTKNHNHMMYGSWDTEWGRHNFLSFWAIFCPFEIFFYTLAPLLLIIWCMVPEIWSAIDIIFCYSGLFFALLPLYWPRKSKFWKNEKNTWRYYHFTNV